MKVITETAAVSLLPTVEMASMNAKLKVLIIEDDLMIADMIEEILSDSGYDVCGIGCTVGEALALGVAHNPDLALVDYRLADNGLGTEVATKLKALGKIGILFATGNSSQVAMQDADGEACIVKPYSAASLIRALAIVEEIVATGAATPPFPRGFQLIPKAGRKEPVTTYE